MKKLAMFWEMISVMLWDAMTRYRAPFMAESHFSTCFHNCPESQIYPWFRDQFGRGQPM